MSAHGVPSGHADALDAWPGWPLVVGVTRPSAELAQLLDDLRPAELALRDWVRIRLNATIVREMAHLDYGRQADEHRRGIEELLVVNRLPEELPWNPGEVLELSSHEPLTGKQRRSGWAGERGHVARLFSCLVLVRADDTLVPAAKLAQLVESALELGPEATEHTVRFLAWCRLHEPGAWRHDDAARPFLTWGLLLLYVMAPGARDPAVAARLIRRFVDDVAAALPPEYRSPDQTPTAMLRKTAGGPGWRVWQALTGRCLIDGTAGGRGPGALLDHAIPSQTTVSIDTLRTWFGIENRSGPPSGR